MRSIVHNETQDGKGPADLHFAGVTRYVDRYIEILGLDVVTSMDLVNAINHGNGLKDMTAQIFDINMEHTNMKFRKAEQKKKAKYSSFRIIGCSKILEYCWDDSNGSVIMAESRAYKYSNKVRWDFRLHSSTRLLGSAMIDEEGDEEEGSPDGAQSTMTSIDRN